MNGQLARDELIEGVIWLVECVDYDTQDLISVHRTRDEAIAEGRRYAIKHEREEYPDADLHTILAITREHWSHYRVGSIKLGPYDDSHSFEWEGLGDPPSAQDMA